MTSVLKQLKEQNILFETDVLLKNKTWIKTGGVASLWITPSSVEELIVVIRILQSEKIEFELVGHTSNLYYIDSYNPTVIVSTILLKQFEEEDGYIVCACGTPVTSLSRYCVEKGYVGYCGLVNLPGTVGAAIYNNSSCFDCSISEHLIEATFYDLDKKGVVVLKPQELGFSFRSSLLKRHEIKGVLLSIKLDIRRGDIEEEQSKAAEAIIVRKKTQEPPAYTLGSVYAGLIPRRNILNKLASGGGILLKIIGLYTKGRYIRLLLALYGFNDLKDFVSDKVINTFIWLPDRTDKEDRFRRYQTFISKAFKEPRLEIEIRNGCR